MIGRVVSTKSLKTATVLVTRTAKHALYKKTYVQSKKYLVDDQIKVRIGDIVEFIKCKPISKRKNWTITKILGKTFKEIAEEQLKKGAEETIAAVMPEAKTELRVESEESSKEKVENLSRVASRDKKLEVKSASKKSKVKAGKDKLVTKP